MSTQYALFDTLLEPVFILNAEGKVLYCNETAALICGLSVRKISRGMLFSELMTFSEPIEALTRLTTVQDPTPYKEVNFETPQGQKGKVQITLQPIQSASQEPNWVMFVRDVTLEERLQKKYRAELEQKEDVILALQKAQQELEQYSKNLEKMVEERTLQISSMNRLMKALLDSLSQGFFIFNKDGLCLEVSSKACETTIETSPAGKMIWDVLKLGDKKAEGFKKWMMTLFMEMLPFEDLAPLGPTEFPHSENKNIALEYFPLRNDDQQIDGVVVVASDITSLVEARKQAETEKQHAKLIIHLIRSKNEMGRFIRESQSMLQDLQTTLAKNPGQWDTEAIFRSLHTLKGGAGLFSVQKLADSCHAAETCLSAYKETTNDTTAAQLLKQCQEVQSQFAHFLQETKEILGSSILSQERLLEVPASDLNILFEKLQSHPQALAAAEKTLGHLLFEPVKNFFEPYKEVAHRIAEKENKVLREIQFMGEDLTVVPEIYGPLFATFVHAFRNAVDHGIEAPAVRHQAGKPEGGSILVRFERRDLPAPTLRIALTDDGAGIDTKKIRAKLATKGISTHNETDREVMQHIFDSQFSTKEQVTETSGRGVGMDAIKYEAQQLGGKAWVESALGKGSTLYIEVPYRTQIPNKKAA